MSLREAKLELLEQKIRWFHHQSQEAGSGHRWAFDRARSTLLRWALMLYWKFLKDDVKVRAESLAFLMIFSFLPLVAGAFFIFGIFTQFGMVQEAISTFVENLMASFPTEQRAVLSDYVLQLKDNYMGRLSETSSSLGIFALLILAWVGMQSYDNLDRTLNFIWSSDRQRPWLEKARNFLVVAFVAPFVLIASLSVPLVLQRVEVTRELLQSYPALRGLIHFLVPSFLTLATFTSLYRFVPVSPVPWRSALSGGAFASVLLYCANLVLTTYFRFGTHTIYGKAAILPLLCLWIYVVWIIVILGAEIAYLIDHRHYLTKAGLRSPTFAEAESLLTLLCFLQSSYVSGAGPVPFRAIFEQTLLDGSSLRRMLRYLENRGIVYSALRGQHNFEYGYILGRDIQNEPLANLLEEYLFESYLRHPPKSQAAREFHETIRSAVQSYGRRTLKDCLQDETRVRALEPALTS